MPKKTCPICGSKEARYKIIEGHYGGLSYTSYESNDLQKPNNNYGFPDVLNVSGTLHAIPFVISATI